MSVPVLVTLISFLFVGSACCVLVEMYVELSDRREKREWAERFDKMSSSAWDDHAERLRKMEERAALEAEGSR